MAMPPKKNLKLDVVLPYRRTFITSDTLSQTVADVMAEFDKLEMATDELIERFGGDEYLRKLQEFKDELEKIKKDFQKDLEGITDGDTGKKVDEIAKKLDSLVQDEDALVNKLNNILREDMTNAQKEVLETLKKEIELAKEGLAAAEKTLSQEVADMQRNLDAAKEQWKDIEIDDEKLKSIKDALDSDLAEKIKAGDNLIAAQVATLKQAMADDNSAMAQSLEGVKSQTNANKAEITSMKESQTTNQESTAKAMEALEAKYSNVWDKANQASEDAQAAKKDGEMALNSTKYMKTYQLMTEGTPAPAAPNILRSQEVDTFAGVKELREDTLLHTAKPGINLVVVDRNTQAPKGNYFWEFKDGQDAKWIKDFDTRVKSFGEDYLQMAFTYHYDKEFLPKLASTLALIGGNEDNIKAVKAGDSYALIGYQGIKAAQEHLSPKEAEGKLNLSLSMYRRNVVGLDGFTPSQFREMEDRINTAEERLMKEVKLANARIDGESTARANADGALTKKIEVAESKANANAAAIKKQETTFSDALKAQTERITGAESKVGQAVSSMTSLEKTLTDKLNATTSKVDGMDAKVAGSTSKIEAESKARAAADEAVAKQVAAMQSTVNGNDALVKSLQKTVADNSSATAQRIDSIVADLDATSKANIDNATNLDTQSKNVAKITTDLKATTDKSNSTATAVTGLTTRLGTAEGSITDVKKSVSTLDGNVTSRLNALESSVGEGVKAQIAALEKTVTDKDKAMATRMTAVEAKAAGNSTAITNESTARANAIKAEAAARTTLQSEVNGVKSTVQTVSTTSADVKKNFEAMWGVKTQVNQITAGFGLIQDGTGSAFVVDADKFKMLNRTGGVDSPFQVVNNVVKMKNAYIDDAYIKNLAAQSINTVTFNAVKITGGQINIASKFIVDAAGNVTVQTATNNVGLKIRGSQILVYDAAQKLRVKIGQI